MSHHFDVWDDGNLQQLHRLSMIQELPDFVKTAASTDVLDKPESELPPRSFADPIHRKYPVHNKAMTYLSAAYFVDNLKTAGAEGKIASDHLDRFISGRILKMASFWGIRPQVEQVFLDFEKHAAATVEDFPDDKFGLVIDWEGKKERRFPLVNPISIRKSAEQLHADCIHYPYEWRCVAAQRILKAAEENVIDLGEHEEYLQKAAGYGFATNEEVARQLCQKALMLKDRPDLCEKIAELGKIALESPSSVGLCKTAALAVDAVDREVGFHRQYGKGVQLPEELFFQVTIKEAEDLKDSLVQLITGTIYKKADLADLDLQKIAEILGSDIADQIVSPLGDVDLEKFSTIAETLPLGDARLLEAAIGDAVEAVH